MQNISIQHTIDNYPVSIGRSTGAGAGEAGLEWS